MIDLCKIRNVSSQENNNFKYSLFMHGIKIQGGMNFSKPNHL